MKRLQQEHQEQQQIPSASAPLQSDPEFHLASESTVPAPTLSYEAPQDEHSTPASNIDFSHQPASSLLPVNLDPSWQAPESWSTVATSGIPDSPRLDSANLGSEEISSGNWSDIATELNSGERGIKARSRSGSNSGTIEWSGEELPLKRASQEVDSPISSAQPDNKLHFSPSTISPHMPQPPQPPHFGSSTEYHGSLNAHTSPQSPVFSSSRPQIHDGFVQQSPPAKHSLSRAPPPPVLVISRQVLASLASRDAVPVPVPVPVPVQEDPVELTPGIISKAQKHCRFAISALNYDDAEQARKELRAALALLGG